MKKLLVPVVIELDAGLVGTSQTEVHTLEVPEHMLTDLTTDGKETLDEYIYCELSAWCMAVDHASSYGIEQGENGFYGEGEEEGDTEEPCSIVHGIYEPEVHDYYRGGGSFLEENGIKEAYDNYEAFKKTL